MKVTNALVTWDDLATMSLTAKGTPPTGLGIANKAELIAAYYVNEAASPFSTYTPDRCPPYQTIQNTTTTTTTNSVGVFLCVTNREVFPYPVTAGNGSASGTLYNNSGSTVYIYGVFNSGGNSSGSINADSGLVNGLILSFSGTITSSGQTKLSNTQVALANGAFVNWSLGKQDGLSSGATLRLGYALSIGGSVTNLGESCIVPPITTTTTTTTTYSPTLTCYTISSSTTYLDGCNESVDLQELYTVTLRDQFGNPIAAPYTITFEFSYDYGNAEDNPICENSGIGYATLHVYAGNSSGQYTFNTYTNQYCCESGICNGSCYSYQDNVTYLSNSVELSLC